MTLVFVNHLQAFTLDSARAGETETMEVIHDDSLFGDVMTTRI